ncbi:MAG: DNA sulfur modification protein DndD [Candidatus Nanohaloarchaea archaeon]
MRINKLAITDFGPYRGRNEIELTSNDESPIVLFGGKNGAGKTTLFNAIGFCLHGKSSLGRRTARKDYERAIRSKLHEYPDGKAESAAVRMEFEYAHMGEVDHYSVERSWRDRGKSIVEDLEVRRNGQVPSELNEDQWQDFLKELVPPGVSQLFFFDGEKIQELASAVESDADFEDSMYSLLGLDLIERLDTDLSIYISQKLEESGVEGINEEIEVLREERDSFEQELEDFTQEKKEKEQRLKELESKIENKESKIAQEGGSYADKREELKKRRAELNANIDQYEEQIREIAEGAYPFTLTPDLCQSVVDRLQTETERQNKATARDELTDELDDVLKDEDVWEEMDLPEDQLGQVAERIQDKLQGRLQIEEEDPELAHQFSEAQRQEIYSLVDRALNDVPDQLAEATENLEEATRERQEVESGLGKAPDQEIISPLIESLNELTEEKGAVRSRLEELEEEISKAQTKLERKGNEIKNKLEEKARVEGVSERADLASDVRAAVQDFREELAKKKLRKLESRLSERYITLSNKGEFYDEIEIDEETLDISIKTIHGNKKPHTELSAGERQIFATSLLWALAEISDRPLPFIVDTPLGRLDNDHRDNLITHFFPEAAHQVIIFSTDTEIDDNQYRKLEGYISQAYHLEYDEAEGRTIPSEGYFWGGEDNDSQKSLEEITS